MDPNQLVADIIATGAATTDQRRDYALWVAGGGFMACVRPREGTALHDAGVREVTVTGVGKRAFHLFPSGTVPFDQVSAGGNPWDAR